VSEIGDNDLAESVQRFVRTEERDAAAGAIDYAAAMVADRIDRATVATWCYELAAQGVDYRDWPELVALRARRTGAGGDEASESLQRARTASEALGLIDLGEI
jgi:hypothetical protein